MLKKAFIYFLLLSFLNTSFLPGENVDDTPYNGIEEVEEEYNSIYELVQEGFMGVQDDTPEDEDDDNPDWLKKDSDFLYKHDLTISLYKIISITNLQTSLILKTYNSFLEISSPPPKQA